MRRVAMTFREPEQHCRRSAGGEHLGMRQAHLQEEDGSLDEMRKVGWDEPVVAGFLLSAGHPSDWAAPPLRDASAAGIKNLPHIAGTRNSA